MAGTDFVQKTTRTIFWALLLDILSFTIVLPLLPRLLQHYEQTEGKNTVRYSICANAISRACFIE
jgi:hypothetical protein